MDNEELNHHKKSDKLKWIVTAVAFLLVFALLIGLCVAVFRTNGTDKEEQTGEVLTYLLAFDNSEEKRTAYSADEQVWEDNGIVFTNLKGSGSDIGDFSDPIRLYAHSAVTIECINMTKIVFYCAGSSYARTLRDSMKTASGVTMEMNGSEVTAAFDPAVKTFEIENLEGQVQLNQVAVTVVIPAAAMESANAVDGDGNFLEEGKTYAMPASMSFSSEALAEAVAAGTSVDVKVSVTVYPVDAADKTVDFSVAWGVAPTNGKNAVTDYLTVTPDSDGSTTATVSCKKAFGSDQIIITATSRDGGCTATCTVTFVGKASGMSVTSTSLTAKSNTGRGSYFELGTGKSYNFDVNLTNVFNSVGSKNLSVKLGGSGSLYFGKYWSDDAGGIYGDMAKKEMSEMVNTFITSATVSGTTLTIQTGKTYIENYYSREEADPYYTTTYYYDKYVRYDEYGTNRGHLISDDYDGNANYNKTNIDNCYFSVTVTDSVSGLSQTIKLWVVSSVSSLSFSKNTLTF